MNHTVRDYSYKRDSNKYLTDTVIENNFFFSHISINKQIYRWRMVIVMFQRLLSQPDCSFIFPSLWRAVLSCILTIFVSSQSTNQKNHTDRGFWAYSNSYVSNQTKSMSYLSALKVSFWKTHKKCFLWNYWNQKTINKTHVRSTLPANNAINNCFILVTLLLPES